MKCVKCGEPGARKPGNGSVLCDECRAIFTGAGVVSAPAKKKAKRSKKARG